MFRTLKFLLWLLLPFGIIHLSIVILRNKLYDWQIFKTNRLPRPVISIGNIQMGGTGKTPLTIAILEKFQDEGLKIGLLSRGYRRNSIGERIILKQDDVKVENIGDEPAAMFAWLRNGALGIGANRFRVAMKMFEESRVDLFLLDDGLQHRKLYRDVDICLIDVTRWQPHPFLFPFSYLRDCKSSLRRCQAVVLTKINSQKHKAERLRNQIKRKHNIPIFEGDLEPQSLINMRDGTEVSFTKIRGKKAAAFCGIARPNHFFSMLKHNGVDLILEKRFADHHHYSLGDLRNLRVAMKELGVGTAIATEKDAVKLGSLIKENVLSELEFFFLRVQFVMEPKEEFFGFFSGLSLPKSFK